MSSPSGSMIYEVPSALLGPRGNGWTSRLHGDVKGLGVTHSKHPDLQRRNRPSLLGGVLLVPGAQTRGHRTRDPVLSRRHKDDPDSAVPGHLGDSLLISLASLGKYRVKVLQN